MKRVFLFIMMISLVAACDKSIEETPQLKDAGVLDISFVYNGAQTRGLMLSPVNQLVTVHVSMNNDNVGWMVSSDSPEWCIVDEEETHTGSGTFDISVIANTEYEDRDVATVTLTAGEYKTTLLVNQHGNVFILDRKYHMSNRTSGSMSFSVKIQEGYEWSMESPEWITVTKGTSSEAVNGEVETMVSMSWDANDGESRFANIEFIRGNDEEASAKFSVYQLGTEYQTLEDGTVILDSENAQMVEIKAPANTFGELVCPDWVTAEKMEDEGDVSVWHLYFGPNPSDCESIRNAEISLVYYGTDYSISLPVISQDYYPVGGLISAKGFEVFSQRFNSGGDVSPWVSDGRIKLMANVDMSEMEVWTPVGTEDMPFDMEFDGGLYKILNFTSAAPLFGVCDGAVISDVVFDNTCNFCIDNDYNADCWLAPLAGRICNTRIVDCTNNADVKLQGESYGGPRAVFIGGLVGQADETSEIMSCENHGSIEMMNESAVDATACVGGIAGCSGAKMENLLSQGRITVNSGYKYLNIGGIAGLVQTGNLSGLSSGGGNISVGSNCTELYCGGLIGRSNADLALDFTDKDPVTADISLSNIAVSNSSLLAVGGMIGKVDGELVLTAAEWSGNIAYDISKVATQTKETGFGGIVGMVDGYLEIDGAVTSGAMDITTNTGVANKGAAAYGGIAGIAYSGASIRNSINGCVVEWNLRCGSSNGNVICAGGIIGRINKGLSVIEGCRNKVMIWNLHYNNNAWSKGTVISNRTGGILGCYGYEAGLDAASSKITISDCHNEAAICSFRGLTGGIAGLLVNADIRNCSFTGECLNGPEKANKSLGASNPYAAGISGAVENTVIRDCFAVADLYGLSAGSCDFRAGGIVAFLCSGSKIENCRYYGNIRTGDNKDKLVYYGCVAAVVEDGCSISDCGVGGSLLGTNVTASNFADCIVGDGTVTPTGCYYWKGE